MNLVRINYSEIIKSVFSNTMEISPRDFSIIINLEDSMAPIVGKFLKIRNAKNKLFTIYLSRIIDHKNFTYTG